MGEPYHEAARWGKNGVDLAAMTNEVVFAGGPVHRLEGLFSHMGLM